MEVNKINRRCWPIQGIWVALIVLCFVQCKEIGNEGQDVAYDSSKPLLVTNFLPKEGGAGSNLIIYGDNFGNDISRLKVVIGGKTAKVVSVNGNSLYCIVPSGAFDGDIKVYVLDESGEEELAHGEASEVFAYEKKWVVSDFVGTYYQVGSQYEEKEGPFGNCGAFKGITWFTWDPQNPNHLYFAAESSSARKIDLQEQYVYFLRTPSTDRRTVITWRLDGDRDMIVVDNHTSDTKNAFYTFSRVSNFMSSQVINLAARGVNGAAVHPINGELYYSRYRVGDVRRYDFTTGEDRLVYPNSSATAIYIVIHPSGEYAYITNYEKHCILRSDYDPDNKIFKVPYTVAGTSGSAGYNDNVGTDARLRNPVQGVFVKNQEYEAQGGDQYDYYFCDRNNHAVRKLTPRGRVSTFAGRGNNSETGGYANGDLRLESRFNQPTAITYDEARKCFYVGEIGNWIIRKIAKEGE